MLKNRVVFTASVSIVVIAAVWIVSCGDTQSPTSASDSSSNELVWLDDAGTNPDDPTLSLRSDDSTKLLDDSQNLLDASYREVTTDTADVSADTGGTIVMRDFGDFNRLIIPDSVLYGDTAITVTSYRPKEPQPDRPANSELALEFAPSGLVFAKPLTMELEARLFGHPSMSGSPAELSWQYLDPLTEEWQEYERVTVDSDKIFRVPVHHFSTYRAIVTRYEAFSQGGQQ